MTLLSNVSKSDLSVKTEDLFVNFGNTIDYLSKQQKLIESDFDTLKQLTEKVNGKSKTNFCYLKS